jgi:hypothetical protein
MKQDIREIFKNEALQKKKLPNFHEDEFLGKLEKTSKKKPISHIWKIAVSIALLFSVGYYFLNTKVKIEPTLFVQVKQIEKEYLQNIKTEWKNFVALTDDENLIKKYKEKLSALDVGYKEITKQFNKAPNNIFVLEKLIKNLQTRLQFLKDIQSHIKILNQKNISYETITI